MRPVKTVAPVWLSRYLTPTMLADQAIELEASGYVDDLIVWDQLIGSRPPLLWTKENTPLYPAAPDWDSFPNAYATAGYLSRAVPSLGSTITTDVIRQGPSEIMQAMLTLSDLTEGKATFAIGAGEVKQCYSYGWKRKEGLARMEDHFKIYREFLDAEGPIDFEGNHWKLDQAWLGESKRYKPRFHGMGGGPKLIELATSYCDGFVTVCPGVWTSPERTAEHITELKGKVAEKGRDAEDFEFGVCAMMLCHEDPDVLDRVMDNPIVKWETALFGRLKQDEWHDEGLEPIQPEGWHYAMKFNPTKATQEDVDAVVNRVTREHVEKSWFIGNPEQIASQLEPYIDAGVNVVWVMDLAQIVLDPDDYKKAPARCAEICKRVKEYSDSRTTAAA